MNRNVVFSCFSMVLASSAVMSEPREAGPRSAVNAFYKAFNNGFVEPADYATGDWNHIPPNGRRFNGRDATLEGARRVHQTFLKGATDTIKTMDIRFASDDVAVATVVSAGSPFATPHVGPGNTIRTFVVVKRGDRWLIMQDQAATIAPPVRR